MKRISTTLSLCAIFLSAAIGNAQVLNNQFSNAPIAVGQPAFPCLAVQVLRRWQPAVQLYTGNGVQLPHVATGPNGGATAVWIARDAFGNRVVFASRYTPPVSIFGNGVWTPAFQVGVAGSNTTRVRVAMDELGNSLIAWDGVPVGGNETIMTRMYHHTIGWRNPSAIPGSGFIRREVAVALAGGQGVVVWTNKETMFTSPSIYASRLIDPPFTWTIPAAISDEESVGPLVAMDSKRRIVTAWQQADGGIPSILRYIYGAKYVSPGPWSVPQSLAPLGLDQRALAPDLALNRNGIGVLGWLHKGALSGEAVRVRRIDLSLALNAGFWTTVQLGNPADFLSSVKVSIDNSGNVGTAFLKHPLAGVNSVYARILTAANIFPDPSKLLDTKAEDASQIWTGMDAGGNGLTGWVQSNGVPSIMGSFGNRVPASTGCPVAWTFSTPFDVEAIADPAREQSGAMSPTRFAAMLWTTGGAAGGTAVHVRVVQ